MNLKKKLKIIIWIVLMVLFYEYYVKNVTFSYFKKLTTLASYDVMAPIEFDIPIITICPSPAFRKSKFLDVYYIDYDVGDKFEQIWNVADYDYSMNDLYENGAHKLDQDFFLNWSMKSYATGESVIMSLNEGTLILLVKSYSLLIQRYFIGFFHKKIVFYVKKQ